MAGTDNFAVQQLQLDNANQKIAQILDGAVSKGLLLKPLTLDLTNGYGPPYGNPYPVKFPFRGVFVRAATDSATSVSVAANDDSQFSLDNSAQLFYNDYFDFGEMLPGGSLVCPPQPGKSVTLWFVTKGKMTSGSQVSTVSGGVNITSGTGMTPQPCVAVGTSAKKILATNVSRKKALLCNLSGTTIWISGTSAVVSGSGTLTDGVTLVGVPLGPGASMEWTNTGDIYGIADAGTSNFVSVQTES